jgi:hypothetical protein
MVVCRRAGDAVHWGARVTDATGSTVYRVEDLGAQPWSGEWVPAKRAPAWVLDQLRTFFRATGWQWLVAQPRLV